MNKIIVLICLLTLCFACSRSGKRAVKERSERVEPANALPRENHALGTSVVKMTKRNGVYIIPVLVNQVPMHFIFDTGASDISISQTEALFLYKQGKLSESDIIGSTNFMDATGNISEGTLITLSTVKIGDRKLEQVQASVVHNQKAPLLFGQSALERFGKISIDYKRGEIIFE